MIEVEVASSRMLLRPVASLLAGCQTVAVSCHLHPQPPSPNNRPEPLPCTPGRKLGIANAVGLIRLGSKVSTVDVFGTCGTEAMEEISVRAERCSQRLVPVDDEALCLGRSLTVDIGGRTDIRGGFASSRSRFAQ